MRFLRRLLGLAALVGLAVGGAVVARRRLSGPEERADCYFADGTMASFEEGSPEGARMFALARDALAAARAG